MYPMSRQLLVFFVIAFTGCQSRPQTLEEQAIAIFEKANARVVLNADGHATQVYLNGSQVHDTEIIKVADLHHLVHIEMVGSPITDASVEHLAKATSLRSIDLSFSQITEKGVRKLRKALPRCRITYSDQKRYAFE